MLRKNMEKTKLKKSARITYKVIFNLFLIFIVFGLIGVSFVGGVGAGYFASLVKDEPIRSKETLKTSIYNYEETTDIYFNNNVYLGKFRSALDREEVDLDKVSDYVKKAVIATEDQYFYDHNGIVPKAILRAIYQQFTNTPIKSGGSTLTQQLVKNQILTNEVSFERKAKEILLAMRLENFFEKDEILEAYLNVVPFGRNSSGRNIAGIKAAANGIFGVEPSELNLPQAAYIAGLPQSPFGYTPFTSGGKVKENIQPSLNRMKTVLNRMLTTGYITESEYKEALSYDIRANLAPYKPSPVQQYPWLTFEIEKRAKKIMANILAKKDGITKKELENDEKLYNKYLITAERDLRRNGYQIYTTIDKKIYDKMQEIKNNYKYYGNDKPETIRDPKTGELTRVLEPVEVGAMLIENKTGKIISFIGGRDFNKEKLNHATNGKRSNGSTMKPLLVYGPAIELGAIQPGSVIADIKTEIPAGPDVWSPKNYGSRYHGLTSARYALARSYNVPAARTYTKIIDHKPTTFLEKMGFTSLTKGDTTHLSMALGALDKGVTVEENVNAYSTFANGGKFVDAYMIEKIVSKDGEIIYQHQPESVEVFSPQTAYLTLDMMRDVIHRGTARGIPSKLKFESDWAGKTGTSQEYRDAWFIATNPKVTFGVWMGYDTPKPLERSYQGYSYSQRNQMLWAQLMNATYELNPKLVATDKRFKMPGGIVRRSYCATSGLLPSDLCREAGLVKTDLFNAKNVPTKEDNSLEKGHYVVINNKKYIAKDSTPSDFIQEGIILRKEFIAEKGWDHLENMQQLIPNQDIWKNIIVPESKDIKENGKVPTPVTGVTIKENTLTWDVHSHSDIIGYRIYQASYPYKEFKHVQSIINNEKLEYTIKEKYDYFYITAVDIDGNESPPSEQVTIQGLGIGIPEDYPNHNTKNKENTKKDREKSDNNSPSNTNDKDNTNTNEQQENLNGNNTNEQRNSNSNTKDKDNSDMLTDLLLD